MYKLIGLLNDSTINCGVHHTLEECREVSEQIFQFMHQSKNIIHMTFIAECGSQCIHTWIYKNNSPYQHCQKDTTMINIS